MCSGIRVCVCAYMCVLCVCVSINIFDQQRRNQCENVLLVLYLSIILCTDMVVLCLILSLFISLCHSVSPSVDTHTYTQGCTHTHKCTKLQMCLFMFSVPLPLLAEVTCTIPSVERGKMTTLTCHFNMNMQENRKTIVVKRKTNASAEQSDYNGLCLHYLVLFLCHFCTFLCSFSSLCMWYFFLFFLDKLGQVLVISH